MSFKLVTHTHICDQKEGLICPENLLIIGTTSILHVYLRQNPTNVSVLEISYKENYICSKQFPMKSSSLSLQNSPWRVSHFLFKISSIRTSSLKDFQGKNLIFNSFYFKNLNALWRDPQKILFFSRVSQFPLKIFFNRTSTLQVFQEKNIYFQSNLHYESSMSSSTVHTFTSLSLDSLILSFCLFAVIFGSFHKQYFFL